MTAAIKMKVIRIVMRKVRYVILPLVVLSDSPAVNQAITNLLIGHGESEAAETTRPGDPERGRDLFNGRAICSTCHGIDGDQSRRPLMTPNTARAIAGLRPPPANLRATGTLKLKTDAERFDAIRNGHLLTLMEPMPDEVLSDRDIGDLLAYLALLRSEGGQPSVP